MSYFEIFSEELRFAHKLDDVIKFVQALPTFDRKKFYIMQDWCAEMGIPFDYDIIERIKVFV